MHKLFLDVTLSKINSNKMGREKIDESKKKIRIDVFIEKEKADLLDRRHCVEISKEAIEKEYKKQIKRNS